MIRLINISDMNKIDKIGSSIHNNFVEKYDIKDFLNNDYGKILVFEQDDYVVGFVQVEDHIDYIDIINIAVEKDYRGNGIGKSLIDYIINVYKKRIVLEVREDNISALTLYKKCGFVVCNIRKKYYGDVDAFVMELII